MPCSKNLVTENMNWMRGCSVSADDRSGVSQERKQKGKKCTWSKFGGRTGS